MSTKITYPNLHKKENDSGGMSYKEINRHIKEVVMESMMTGKNVDESEIVGYLNVVADDLELVGSSSWGQPNSWYTSGKFLSDFNGKTAIVHIDPEKWLRLHDAINHGREGATPSTVDWVVEKVENGETSEIPTPTLALEPSNYGDDPIEYEVTKEGRSRGVGAKKAGLDKMPVLVSVRRPSK